MILNDKTASGNIIGRALLIEETGVYVYNQRTERIEIDHNIYDSLFIYEMLNSPAIRDKIIKQSQGNTQIYVNWPTISLTDYLVPKIEEQRKIGRFFSELDNLITLHQRNIYTAPPYNPISWEQRKLSEVTESIKNGYTYKADGSRDHRYKITRIESISSGVINTEKLGSSDEVNENYKLADGDILFSHINSLPYIANTALYTADLGEIYHGMNLLNIRSKHEEIDSHFLLHLLKKESTRDWFRIIAKPAVNQASISTTEVGSFEFLIPRMEEQKKISSVLDNLDNLITLHRCVY